MKWCTPLPRCRRLLSVTFWPGPGEGVSFHAISLNFEGVVRVEGTLLRFVPAFGRALAFAKRQHQRFSP